MNAVAIMWNMYNCIIISKLRFLSTNMLYLKRHKKRLKERHKGSRWRRAREKWKNYENEKQKKEKSVRNENGENDKIKGEKIASE